METEIGGRVSTLEYRREDDVNAHNALCEIVNGLMKRVEDLENTLTAHNATRGDVQAPVANDGGWIVGVPTAEMYPGESKFEITLLDEDGERWNLKSWFNDDGEMRGTWQATSKCRILAHRSAAPYAGKAVGE